MLHREEKLLENAMPMRYTIVIKEYSVRLERIFYMGKLIDEQFKDSSPQETVKRIRGILSGLGLSVTETWCEHAVTNCYALTVEIDGTRLRTAGKGVTPDLARASGYAELMERLQSGLMNLGRKMHYNDAVMMDRQALKTNCQDYFSRFSKVISKFCGVEKSVDQLVEACFEYECGGETTEVIPFYSVTDDDMVYVPTRLMLPLYSSSGNCAGNTPAEAIVQGTSEIIERWCQRHFMSTNLVPPTIPEDYLKQFPRAYETITDIRSKGLDIIIKDCSMGTGYPVIATAVINKKTHCYHVHMGASPIFEIALGRSLTETFQGRVINSVADTSLAENISDSVSSYRKAYVYGRGVYPISFFSENSSFPFVPFPDRTGCSNMDLLQYVLDYIKNKGMKLYIRDVSHMGFTSYKIIVPDICDASLDFLLTTFPVSALSSSTEQVKLNLKNANADQLFEMQLLNTYRVENSLLDGNPKCSMLLKLPVTEDRLADVAIGYIHLGFVEWGCGNTHKANLIAKKIAALNCPGISEYFSCLCRTGDMLKSSSLDDVLNLLSLFYDAEIIAQVKQVYTEDINPFRDYVITCDPDNGSCSSCRYAESCVVVPQKKLAKIVNSYVEKFDNEKAFTQLKNLFRSLSVYS